MRARIRYQQVYIKLILYDISPRGELKLEFSSANSNANIRIAVANRIYKQETRRKVQMKVQYKIFRSKYKPWDELFTEALQFASKLSRENLINISHSCDHKREGVVTVWFWESE